jgi:hypothetical protein
MKYVAHSLLPLCLLIAAAPVAAKNTQPHFNTIVVSHFANANGMNQSQDFINYFCDSLRSVLQQENLASQIVEESAQAANVTADDSLLIEGKFTGIDKGNLFVHDKLGLQINIYRMSDHALVKTITTKVEFETSPLVQDMDKGDFTGRVTAFEINKALKNVSLSSIPAAPSGTGQAAH